MASQGTDRPLGRRSATTGLQTSPGASERGFTLVELSVVALLIVVLAAVAVPFFAGFWRASEERNCAWRVAALAHRARDYAISHAVRVALEYREADGQFCLTAESDDVGRQGDFQQLQLAGARPVSIPDSIEQVDVQVEGRDAGPDFPIVFFPDGQALAARIVLEGSQTDWSVEIVPLTGQAQVTQADAQSQQ
jgi:prepilin-type N-terminal cleavage/methylation domain-containing protein